MRKKSDSDISALFRDDRKVNKQKQNPQPNLHYFPGTFSMCFLFKFFKRIFLETDRIPFGDEGRRVRKEMEEGKV